MIRILHWNIHMWTDADGVDNLDRVTEVIGDADPDVVSLVEVDEPWGQPTKLQQVADQLGHHWAFIPAFEYRETGGFGNAILSRHPLRTVQQWQLLPPMLYDGSEPTEPRALLLAQVQLDDTALLVGSTHLPRSDTDRRKHASSRLLDLLQGLDQPYAICGDFNRPSTDWVPHSITVAPHPAKPTYPTTSPAEPIDYCLAAGIRPHDCTLLQTAASDHLPILLNVSVS